MMRLGQIFSAAALLLLAAGSLCAKEVIKVGVVAPISGSMAFLGQGTREGITLKLRELSDDTKFDYQVIYEDDAYTFSKTATAVRKLKDVDKVDVVLTLWGYGSSIALPILKDSDVVHLSAHRWSDETGALDFATGESAQSQAVNIVEALKVFGYESLFYIGTAEQGSETMRKALLKVLDEAGIELKGSMVLPDTTRDFRTAILKMRKAKPDAILELLTVPGNSLLLEQMKSAGVDIPVVHSSSTVFEIEPSLTEGSITIYPAPPLEDWEARFVEYIGHPSKYPAPQAYNTMELLVRACESLGDNAEVSGAAIAQAIRDVGRYEGSTGELYFVAPNRYEAPVVYWYFKDGKPHVMELEQIVEEVNGR